MVSKAKAAGRPTYHHGNLRKALVEAGTRLAEQGGPEHVGVRAAAREVGVTPTAAYRHFADADELRSAVKDRAFQALAEAVQAEVASVADPGAGDAGSAGDAGDVAARRLEAIGRGYVHFALAEPGLFRTAFGQGGGTIPTDSGAETRSAFALLVEVLDDLVIAGWLPADRRPLAEIAAWSAVYGLARLLLDGPLAPLPGDVREAALQRTLAMIREGI